MTLQIAQQPDADALLDRDPLALLVGMLLDQQFPMERAFAGPYVLAQRMGVDHLNAHDIAEYDPEKFATLFVGPPAIHRFPGAMAGRVQELARLLVADYDGSAEAVWKTAKVWWGVARSNSDAARFRSAKGANLRCPVRKTARSTATWLAGGRGRVRRGRQLPVGRRRRQPGVVAEGSRPQERDESRGEGGRVATALARRPATRATAPR